MVDLSTDPSEYDECLTSVAATTSGAGSFLRAETVIGRTALNAGAATRTARAARKAGLENMVIMCVLVLKGVRKFKGTGRFED